MTPIIFCLIAVLAGASAILDSTERIGHENEQKRLRQERAQEKLLKREQRAQKKLLKHEQQGAGIHTYFISSEENPSLVKIGKSTDLLTRLTDLQCGSSTILSLVATTRIHGEVEVHSRFANYRKRGEWFDFSAEIKDFIRTNCTIHNPALVN